MTEAEQTRMMDAGIYMGHIHPINQRESDNLKEFQSWELETHDGYSNVRARKVDFEFAVS